MTEPPNDGWAEAEVYDDESPDGGVRRGASGLRVVRPGEGAGMLVLDGRGGIAKTAANVSHLLTESPLWDLRWDEFGHVAQVVACPSSAGAPARLGELDEYHVNNIIQWLGMQHRVVVTKEMAEAGAIHAAKQKCFHPVQDYLTSLEWDGVPRIFQIATRYLSNAGELENHLCGLFMIGAVARAMDPGCKVDSMLVLLGAQGAGKTSFFETLCGMQWFGPDVPDLRSKDAILALRSRWLMCMDELHALRQQDIMELAKSYLTRRFDSVVPKYKNNPVLQPRSCVFVATGNPTEFLSDPTGNRRFWCVQAGKIDVAAVKRDRDQLWAEALHEYMHGKQWWPDDTTSAAIESMNHLKFARHSEWDSKIEAYCEGREFVTISECLGELGFKSPSDWNQGHENQVARAMQKLGRVRRQRMVAGKKSWGYASLSIGRVTT